METTKTPLRLLPYIFNLIARIVAPFFIWQSPFWVTIAMIFLDGTDVITFRFAFSSKRSKLYQTIDKALDYYMYLFLLAYATSTNFFLLLLTLFLARTAGTIIYFIKKDRRIFMLFPNIFENVFIIVVAALTFPTLAPLTEGPNFYLALALATVLKLAQEYIIHVKKLSIIDTLTGISFVEDCG